MQTYDKKSECYLNDIECFITDKIGQSPNKLSTLLNSIGINSTVRNDCVIVKCHKCGVDKIEIKVNGRNSPDLRWYCATQQIQGDKNHGLHFSLKTLVAATLSIPIKEATILLLENMFKLPKTELTYPQWKNQYCGRYLDDCPMLEVWKLAYNYRYTEKNLKQKIQDYLFSLEIADNSPQITKLPPSTVINNNPADIHKPAYIEPQNNPRNDNGKFNNSYSRPAFDWKTRKAIK